MSDTPPTPPQDSSDELIEALKECNADQLRQIAEYAENLASHQEHEGRVEHSETAPADEPPKDLRDGVPAKATITVKTINNNQYYYWQWRDGEKVKSKYKGPVDSTE